MHNKKSLLLLLTLTLVWQASPSLSHALENTAPTEGMVDLRILETTDLHAHLVNYDYYQSKVDNRFGLVKTATLIHQARNEVKNSLLFDDGDHLKGNPLGEFLARIRGIHKGKIHPVYRAFNFLGYDAIAIGNHELNYGLSFLNAALKGAKMPVVNANVYQVKKNKPYFKPYVILKRNVVDQQGKQQVLNVGVIGFMPPQIMKWDKANLEGKVIAEPIVDTAKKYVPIMKAKGADIIIALAHTGISSEPYFPETENAVYYLTQIPGIDAVLAGHSHGIFPGPLFSRLPNTNLTTGQINTKPVVMAGSFGNRLGVIDLVLEVKAGKWKVIKGTALTRPVADEHGKPLVKTDKALYRLIQNEHQETVDFIKKLGL
ncbi:metallophosphoesterase [Neobacillus ginsengisoli]|uniref:2',3'-cyclic-nucleotide 2'-phosphodiesterase/3'-nucleotidase n=1 Tax=Neobacillus ginsengisoli TaxID=904295 RepID=A0ABT9XRX8_9BACI|nr:metallophosphoesterase [Neobacillus ginsengisoli]MDQ0198030.1 2',3'-cyclic-nucleotide 2'-phosphodiesterase/3'-nucleotidase [Neobacillus ginsengisoli]